MEYKSRKKAFTLIELLLAMALMGILIVIFVGNFNTTMKRGRDSQRKSDLAQLQKALEAYYEDNLSYPAFDVVNPNAAKKFCKSETCTGGALETVYMYKVPKDPSSSYVYKYVPAAGGSPSSYYLYSYIENELDEGSNVSQTGFTTNTRCDAADAADFSCKYYVSSSNAAPLTPQP